MHLARRSSLLFAVWLLSSLPSPVLAQQLPAAPAQTENVLLHLLLALVAVIAFAHLVGHGFRRIDQPPVIGEMFAGILLGPSLLGRISHEAMDFVLPPAVAPYLRALAQIGVVIYMFLVGLELDLVRLRQRAGAALVISASGIAVPLLLGSMVAGSLYPLLSTPTVPPFLFGAFFCVALSVTAFPVLARIVTERKLEKTNLGRLALTCAAADDIAAWCLLSIVASFAQAKPSAGLVTVMMSAGYVAFMIVVFRPLFLRWVEREERTESLSRASLVVLFCALLVSALITEWIGIHALFGAFLLGALVPAESKLALRATAKLEDVVAVLFLPIFFAFTGLRTQIGLLSGAQSWLLCGLIVLLAFLGKAGGVTFAARITGVPWRGAMGLGALMNTRGLMELIVLNVGLDLGIISPTLFTMMVIMALATTCMTGPLLTWLGERVTGELEDAPLPSASHTT